MDTNKVLIVATYAGQIILESGGETYRVEETIIRICENYGLKDAESFVTPTGIMCSALKENSESISIVKRVKNRTVNLERIDLVNDLSRSIELQTMPIDTLKDELDKIASTSVYPPYIDVLFSALAASGFSFMFGGNLKDFFCAFFIGIIIKTTVHVATSLDINSFFINSIGGAIGELLALLCINSGIGTHLDTIIIGSIMLLVPGLSITNAIRDTIAGDLVSGLTRAADAFLVAISIAAGTGAVLSIWIKIFGGISL